jgi:hypothetical protein
MPHNRFYVYVMKDPGIYGDAICGKHQVKRRSNIE